MSATATKITAEQYHAQTVEGDHTELVEGAIVVDEPKPIHSRLQGDLYFALRVWTDAAPGRGMVLLPTNVRMDEHNVYGPDVLWFAEEHVPRDLHEYPERVPDLCVEIRSPGTWRDDIGAKKRVYEAGGLRELWLVDDVAKTVLAYRRSVPESESFDVAEELARGETFVSPQFPGFALALDELFAR